MNGSDLWLAFGAAAAGAIVVLLRRQNREPSCSSTAGPRPPTYVLARGRPEVLAVRLLTSVVAPWLVYLLVRSQVRSDAAALAIAGLLPLGLVLLRLAQERRVDWIGIATVITLGLAAAVSLPAGGTSLPLKLPGSVLAAVSGLALLVSVVIHRPLPLVLLRWRARHDPQRLGAINERLLDPARQRNLTVGTVLLGLLFLVSATVHVILAVTLSTATFVAVSGILSWLILGVGGVCIVLYLRRYRAVSSSQPAD